MDAGCSLSPDDLVITTGAMEAITLGLRAITRPGDTVAIETPTYHGFLQVLESLHLKALEIATDQEGAVDVCFRAIGVASHAARRRNRRKLSASNRLAITSAVSSTAAL